MAKPAGGTRGRKTSAAATAGERQDAADEQRATQQQDAATRQEATATGRQATATGRQATATDRQAKRTAQQPKSGARETGKAAGKGPVTLAVDIGGSSVKAEVLAPEGTAVSQHERIKVSYPCPPDAMVGYVCELASRLPAADRISLGFPGMVRGGRVLSAPHYVTTDGPGTLIDDELVAAWTGFDLAAAAQQALGLPARVGNDADVQGLSVVRGEGLELVITLGTGLGTALFHEGQLGPHLELAHHPFRKDKSYNERIGDAARRKVGDDKWTRRVADAVRTLRALTFYDTLYIGGGNASRLTKEFTEPAVMVDNVNGILGGLKLWDQDRV